MIQEVQDLEHFLEVLGMSSKATAKIIRDHS